MVFEERVLVANHRCKAEVVGVRTLEIDCCRGCGKVTEGGNIATNGQTEHLNITRADARGVTACQATSKIQIHEDMYLTEFLGVGNTSDKDARSRSIESQLLLVGRCKSHRYIVRHHIYIIYSAVERIGCTQGHIATNGKREGVALICEDSRRHLHLLNTIASSVFVVLDSGLYGCIFHYDTLLVTSLRSTRDCVGLAHRNNINGRLGIAVMISLHAMMLCCGCKCCHHCSDNK